MSMGAPRHHACQSSGNHTDATVAVQRSRGSCSSQRQCNVHAARGGGAAVAAMVSHHSISCRRAEAGVVPLLAVHW
jgi:hypothetical protein